MTRRICLGLPGKPCHTRTDQARCPTCQAGYTRRRRQLYGGAWSRISRAARTTTPWCSVCGTQDDLTLDHETGTVQCRRHNSSHRGNPGDAKSSAR